MARKRKHKAKPKRKYICRNCEQPFESSEVLTGNDYVCPKCVNVYNGRKNK